MPRILNFKVIVEQDEEGYFVASAPAIPGCHSQGKTLDEALTNIKEAIELCLEVAKKDELYKEKIDFPKINDASRFLGITEVPVQIKFA